MSDTPRTDATISETRPVIEAVTPEYLRDLAANPTQAGWTPVFPGTLQSAAAQIEEKNGYLARAEAAEKDNAFNVDARIKDADDFRLKLKEERQRLTKAEAERDAARAELARLTTAAQEYVEAMRPVSIELPDKMRALVAAIPTPKEATK